MKIEHLTFTRFVAAIVVVFVHIGAAHSNINSLTGSLFRVCNSAVSYFFVLSGFILVVSGTRGGQLAQSLPKGTFWRNRFARIYPLYLTALVLTGGLGLWLGNIKVSTLSIGSVLASSLLVQAWWPSLVMQLNYPGWSLSVEMLFYALFPLVYLSIIRQRTRVLLLAAGLFWVASLAAYKLLVDHGAAPDLTLYFPLLHLNTFLLGVVTGIAFVRHRVWLAQQQQALAAALLALLGLNLWIIAGHLPIMTYYHDGLFAPLFALSILWLSIQTNRLSRVLSRPFPVWLGEISYGIYLLQVPVGMVMFPLNNRLLHWPVWAYVSAYLVLLISIAGLCYRAIEQPARQFIRQWSGSVLTTSSAGEHLSKQA